MRRLLRGGGDWYSRYIILALLREILLALILTQASCLMNTSVFLLLGCVLLVPGESSITKADMDSVWYLSQVIPNPGPWRSINMSVAVPDLMTTGKERL